MKAHVSAITLGVEDVQKAKGFYVSLGWPVEQEHGEWVSFAIGGGASVLGLLPRAALAADAGATAGGAAFSGVTFSYIVRSEERVAEVLAEAERAGGSIVKPAERAPWGGTSGYFSDPDGYLWKVAAGSGQQPFAE